MNTEIIEHVTVRLSADPFNPVINFELAEEYNRHEQYASAITFYLRCAEYGHTQNKIHAYTSLIRIAECFEHLNDRDWSVTGTLLQAAGYMPSHPAAWFYLSRYHERRSQWQEAYTYSLIGLSVSEPEKTLPATTDYLGKFVLLFEKAVTGWWVGRKDESKQIFDDLLKLSLPKNYIDSIQYNMERL